IMPSFIGNYGMTVAVDLRKENTDFAFRTCVKRETYWTRTKLWTNLCACSNFQSMSKSAKTPGTEIPFEEALNNLESIVESMESDELPLETLIARFEEGTRLAKICQTKLAEAEIKIKQLEKNAVGELVLKPIDLGEDSPEPQ